MHNQCSSARKLESGFIALLSVLLIFGILTALGVMAYEVYYKRVNSELVDQQVKSFKYIENNLNTFYYQNIYQIEQNAGNVIQTNTGTFSNYQDLANYLGLSQTDAWNNPYQMFVSNRLTDPITGNYYHLVYIVSLGSSHKLQSSFNQNTGVLTLGGSNIAIEINGKTLNDQLYLNNATQLNQLAKKIQSFARGLYISQNQEGWDYFYNSQDSTCQNIGLTQYGAGLFGCYQGTPIEQTNLPNKMGINSNEYTNTLGVQFVFDNASSSVVTRPPAGQSNTIYTARVGIPESNGKTNWIVFTYLE